MVIMRYCPHCGNQVEDEAVVCVKCGRKVLSVSAERRVSNEYEVTSVFIKIFMILSLFTSAASAIYSYVVAQAISSSFWWICMAVSVLSYSWIIPMTVIAFKKLRRRERIGMAFKICTLLFVNLVAGVLLLCLPEEDELI